MSHEIIGNEPVLFEPSSLEPIVIFFVQNGAEEKERVVTLSDWKDSVTFALNGLNELQRDLARLKTRTQAMQKGNTTRGKPYSSKEKNQINSQVRKDRKRVNATLEQNRGLRLVLAEQGKWLLLSPSEEPLKVRLKTDKQGEIVSGNPLDPGEAAWRMFVFQESEDLWTHPNLELIREYFFLRRAANLKIEDRHGKAEERLEDFRKSVGLIPDELTVVLKKISSLDFTKPLLPVLGTLLRDG